MEHIITQIMPIVATVVGVLLSAMVGMSLSKLQNIQNCMERMHTQFYAHVTDKHCHDEGSINERIKALVGVAEKAHVRIDRLEARQT